jgi:hypothetical protein
MKKLLLSFFLLVFATAMNALAQSPFHPTIDNGVFYLYMGSTGPEVSKIEIFNDNGDLVKEADMVANKEKSIHCEDLASGMYHVMIHMNGQEYYSPLEIKNSEESASTNDPKK